MFYIGTTVCLQQHTATICDTLYLNATYCNTLQHAATLCIANTIQYTCNNSAVNTLQHAATHCSTMQHNALHCTTLSHRTTLHHAAPRCSTLHHTSPHYITLHHTATHCNTLQHTATDTAGHTTTHLVILTYKKKTPLLSTATKSTFDRHKIHTQPCNIVQYTETLQHTATLKHTATCRNAHLYKQHTLSTATISSIPSPTTYCCIYCNTLLHAATHIRMSTYASNKLSLPPQYATYPALRHIAKH